MDELVIGDKKYFSSKKAAEITGYAKDYVGQLCREGRVEARLVGRSWYVLDTSILEHRFGKEESTPVVEEIKSEVEEPVSSWEPSKYVAETVSPLPELITKEEDVQKSINVLNTVSWESEISNKEAAEIKAAPEADSREEGEPVLMRKIEEPVTTEENIDIQIPLHKVTSTPVPTAPRKQESPQRVPKTSSSSKRKRKRSIFVPALLISVALIAILVMIAGTGNLDGFSVVSNNGIVNFLGGKSFYISK